MENASLIPITATVATTVAITLMRSFAKLFQEMNAPIVENENVRRVISAFLNIIFVMGLQIALMVKMK